MLKLIVSFSVLLGTLLSCPTYKQPTEPQRETQQDKKEEVKPTSIVECQLADWCGPCRAFKRSGAISELEKAGWSIKYVTNIGKKYPSFRVVINGKSETFSGYSSKSGFFKKIKAAKERLTR